MLKFVRAVFIVPVILLLAVQVVIAQDAPKGRWWHSPRVVSALNLTPAETEQLEQAYEKFRPQLISSKSKVEQEQFELSNLIEQSTFDEAAIRAQNRKLEQARSELADIKFAFVIEVRKIIGAQRFQQLTELKR
jgi:Spy/CpxP family protein refolding chaperone